MKLKANRQDLLLRVLFISAGVVAAVLFSLQGQSHVLPPLALGGLLGACAVTGLTGFSQE